MLVESPRAANGSTADDGDGVVVAAARIRASISHPHLIRARLERRQSRPALVTELCRAPTLAQVVAGRPLPARDAVAVVGSVASAVGALAAHGLAPRNLSPESIHLHRRRGVILADPGVPPTLVPRARFVAPRARAYLSPEEVRGAPPTPRSIVYSLGAILRDSVRDDVPVSLQRVIQRATAEHPDDRYKHPGAFAAAAVTPIPGWKFLARRPPRPELGAAVPQPRAAPHSVTRPLSEPAARPRTERRGHPVRSVRARNLLAKAALALAALAPRLKPPRVKLPTVNSPRLRPLALRLSWPKARKPGGLRPMALRLSWPKAWKPDAARLTARLPEAKHTAAIGCAVVAAAGAIAIAGALQGGGDGAAPSTPSIGSSMLRMDLPSGWERSRATKTPGLSLAGAVAARSSDEDAGLVVGLARDSGQLQRLVRAAVANGAVRRSVRLGAVAARRWNPVPVGGDATATLFVTRTPRGPLVALCVDQRAGPAARPPACSAALETIRLTSARAVPIGSNVG